tara:strand:- start:323 stop:658 length:336 start_codon:yes stop_codon:yes gene_type:complete
MLLVLIKFVQYKNSSMSTTIDQVQNIQNQVHSLVSAYRDIKSTLEEKTILINQLSDELSNERKKNANLNNQIEQLRLIMAFDGNQKDRAILKGQLSEWVREINKCLTQLNV